MAEQLAATGRVCAYDRDGMGLAAIHDLDRSPVAVAARLEALVAQAEGDAPVILAGHSNGGLYVEAFARLWPERTAGLVLVDAVGTDVKDHPLALADLRREARWASFTPTARALGLTRLVPLMDDISPAAEAAARRRSAWTGRTSIQAALQEVEAFLPGLAAVDALPPLRPTIPVAVIVASRTPAAALDRDWRAAQIAPAQRACRSVVVDARASHTAVLDAQRGHVVDAVGWVNGEGPLAGSGAAERPSESPQPAPHRRVEEPERGPGDGRRDDQAQGPEPGRQRQRPLGGIEPQHHRPGRPVHGVERVGQIARRPAHHARRALGVVGADQHQHRKQQRHADEVVDAVPRQRFGQAGPGRTAWPASRPARPAGPAASRRGRDASADNASRPNPG